VSVTQSFNTTTSMGRLTLNVLLSFAQFEREVTGERVRDKIAASKKKRVWMGGVVPVGYRAGDRALHIVEEHAEIVRSLFRRYLEAGSVVRLKQQREACEAYIKSQAHEGWRLVRDHYDDGGYSGGSMERPALQNLLIDVEARRIDVIVVYKVDRLEEGFAWNGQTFGSLSQIAKAMTGTTWNGHRFFGFRQAKTPAADVGADRRRSRNRTAVCRANGASAGNSPP
jgi:DNA invertase Pin-like site-specific DNA recombinase